MKLKIVAVFIVAAIIAQPAGAAWELRKRLSKGLEGIRNPHGFQSGGQGSNILIPVAPAAIITAASLPVHPSVNQYVGPEVSPDIVDEVKKAHALYMPAVDRIREHMIGQRRIQRAAHLAILTASHLLVNDDYGTGKTRLANGISAIFGARANWMQVHNEIRKAQIIGYRLPDREGRMTGDLQRGIVLDGDPLIVVLDEINRAHADAFNSLAEPMGLRGSADAMIHVDGLPVKIPQDQTYIATQNPDGVGGTRPISGMMADRFGLHAYGEDITREENHSYIRRSVARTLNTKIQSLMTREKLAEIKAAIQQIHISPEVEEYLCAISDAYKYAGDISIAIKPIKSMRANDDLINLTRANAFLEGRAWVIPSDVAAVAHFFFDHRVRDLDGNYVGGDFVTQTVLHEIPSKAGLKK